MVYFLMTGQTQSCYWYALTRFKMELDGELDEFYRDFPAKKRQADSHKNLKKSLGTPSPAYSYYKDLLVDFEVAQAKAFVSVFGGVPHGCFFHFTQCLERRLLKLPKLNKRKKMDTTNKTKKALKSFQALALIKQSKVKTTLQAFLDTGYMKKHEKIFRPFVTYFRKQWTGSLVLDRHGTRAKGKIPWNQYEYFATNGLRTTSSLENWHMLVNRAINIKNPTFEQLFENLQLEQALVNKFLYEQSLFIETSEFNKATREKYERIKKIALQKKVPKKDILKHLGRIATALL